MIHIHMSVLYCVCMHYYIHVCPYCMGVCMSILYYFVCVCPNCDVYFDCICPFCDAGYVAFVGYGVANNPDMGGYVCFGVKNLRA